ncbi:hypothetical protein FRC09_000164 [Ceratobasidium sp. 395]|nr:hypothetical protein FRC09_000164 [Ceratobasidium sp. 395]
MSFDDQTRGLVVLHDELDDARSESRFMNGSSTLDGQSISATVSTGSQARPPSQMYDPDGGDCPLQSHSNQALFSTLHGHEQENDLIMFSPSPPNTSTQSSDPSQATTRSASEQTLMFGKQARKEDIDEWVNKAVESRQWSAPGGGIKCPESGCKSSSRRPHALKDHMYTHYDIRLQFRGMHESFRHACQYDKALQE